MTPEREALARRRSIEINPANADLVREVERDAGGRRGGRRLALLVGNRWPEAGVRLSVQFLDKPSKELRQRLLLHMNAWDKTANIRFVETKGTGHVRLARSDDPDLGGYWSWVGTEILAVEHEDEPTMNLEGFTMKTPDEEFHRVVRHEAGHTLGFDHEHMRAELVKKIDVKKAIVHFRHTDGWSAEETRAQVLTPLRAKSIMGTTEADPTSIMCYQIPGEITKDGRPIPGGLDINEKDFAFAAKVYPKTGKEPPPPPKAKAAAGETATQSTANKEYKNEASESVEPPVAPRSQSLGLEEADTFQILVMDDFDPEDIRSSLADCQEKVALASVGGTAKPEPGQLPPKKPKPKYARVFASYGGARVSCAMRLRADKGEEPTPFGKIIRVHEQIKNYTDREKGSLPDDDEMMKFGTNLFDALFPGVVGRLYDEARSRQRHRKLDLVFTSMIPWIAEKPWEFAYDKVRNSFLATEEIHLIRNVLTAVPANVIPPLSGPLRILVASAQPVGFGRLSITQEETVIRRGFQPLIDAGSVVVKVLPHATPGLIHGELATGNYNIIHFIGHGVYDEGKKEGMLIFENERGDEYPLGERSVREIFCQRGVSLVFLNACQTGAGGRADFNKGVAQSLVAHGLPALVANQYSVLDSSATSFAQFFYWALAQGMSLGQAAREARIAVNYSLTGDPIDWAVPVVYAREPNKSLCAKPETVDPIPATAVRQTLRHALRDRRTRVAFWDIDNVFPALEGTLATMNEAQSEFGFELAALSAPVDAWDLENKSPDGSPYLWANKVAERLKRTTIDLRVDILACITRHWMCNDDSINIYGWWADHQETPVVMFSAAGLDDLEPEGSQTDRLLANVLVLLLAGYFSEMDCHDKKRETECPLFRNADRDFGHMTGPQQFDKICRAKLRTKIPKLLPALETLLQTFQPPQLANRKTKP